MTTLWLITVSAAMCPTSPFGKYLDPSPAVAALRDRLAGKLAFSYQDGHIAAWLTDNSTVKKNEAADAVLDMPGVIAAYRTNSAQNHYVRVGTNPMSSREGA